MPGIIIYGLISCPFVRSQFGDLYQVTRRNGLHFVGSISVQISSTSSTWTSSLGLNPIKYLTYMDTPPYCNSYQAVFVGSLSCWSVPLQQNGPTGSH